MLTFYCCFTHLLSEILNYTLKHILKHPRPESGAPGGGLFEGRYGMPSQHCHCFAYLVTTILMLVFHYYRGHVDAPKRLLVLVLTITGLALQAVGRVYLRFHTISQCLVGVALGCVSATVFYTIGIHYFLPNSDWLCRTWILRVFSFRKDLISLPPSNESGKSSVFSSRQKTNICKAKYN